MNSNIEPEINVDWRIKMLEEKFGEDDFLYSLVLPFIMNIKMETQKLDESKFNNMLKEYIKSAMKLNRPILEYLINKNTKELEKEKNKEGILENKETLNILNESNDNFSSKLLDKIYDYKLYLIIGVILIVLFLRF
jgi:late competence protein required for DNA uptake (superfamily II DNA/RNA helicase)